MLIERLAAAVPACWRVARLATGAEVPTMDILMTVGTGDGNPVEYQAGVTAHAGSSPVPERQGKACGAVIKDEGTSERGPRRHRVTRIAGLNHGTVRAGAGALPGCRSKAAQG